MLLALLKTSRPGSSSALWPLGDDLAWATKASPGVTTCALIVNKTYCKQTNVYEKHTLEACGNDLLTLMFWLDGLSPSLRRLSTITLMGLVHPYDWAKSTSLFAAMLASLLPLEVPKETATSRTASSSGTKSQNLHKIQFYSIP